MCKYCERDRTQVIYDALEISTDRLDVLKRDHLAMEKLRGGKFSLELLWNGNKRDVQWFTYKVKYPSTPVNDPAGAILGVKEK